MVSEELPSEAAPVRDEPGVDALTRGLRRWKITAGILALTTAFLGIALAGQLTSAGVSAQPAATSTTEPAAQSTVPDLARRQQGDPMAIGAVDAPVVLIEWFDYRCPFCAAHANTTMPQLLQEYVASGQVRVEYHDVVFFGEDSLAAAVAGRAAGAQGKFPEFLQVLFAAAPGSGHPDMPRETLIEFARQAGVPDIDAFTLALDDPQLAAQVAESTQYAQNLGITSVPFFVIGQSVLSGAQPADAFRQVIEQELARS